MVLDYDAATDRVWTVEGNAGFNGDAARNTETAITRYGGSEALVKMRDPERIVGWGRLRGVMMK